MLGGGRRVGNKLSLLSYPHPEGPAIPTFKNWDMRDMNCSYMCRNNNSKLSTCSSCFSGTDFYFQSYILLEMDQQTFSEGPDIKNSSFWGRQFLPITQLSRAAADNAQTNAMTTTQWSFPDTRRVWIRALLQTLSCSLFENKNQESGGMLSEAWWLPVASGTGPREWMHGTHQNEGCFVKSLWQRLW